MTTSTIAVRSEHGSGVRRLIARHPVATFLLLAVSMSAVVAVIPALTRPGVLPSGLALYDLLGPLLASALPAFVVVAAIGGRTGVRELVARCFRWRVRLRWYAFALLSVPAAVLVVTVLFYGHRMFDVVVDRWPLIFTATLPRLLMLIVCIVAEEVGFLGFLQARWQRRFSPLTATALVTLPFAAYHLPGTMVVNGFGLAQLHVALAYVAVIGVLQLFGRVVITWIYNATGASVLLAALWHASFDVTTTAFSHTFALPAVANAAITGFWIPSGVTVAFAVAVAVLTRGRLDSSAARDRSARAGRQ
jgi:uncharacterized protein